MVIINRIIEEIFDDKVPIATGGIFNSGHATAIAFARRGARVGVAYLVEDKENTSTKCN